MAQEAIDLLVLATVNASWRRRIDLATLLDCLRRPSLVAAWPNHLVTFFSEVPIEVVERLMSGYGLAPATVLAALRTTRTLTGMPGNDLEAWLGDLADAAA